MMYCAKCGTQLMSSHKFCPKCGEQVNSGTKQGAKTKGKKSTGLIAFIIALCILIALAAVVSLIIKNNLDIDSVFNKPLSLDIEYSPNGIREFMEGICKRMDVEYADVISVGFDGLGLDYGTYYVAELAIKPYGKVEETIKVRFYNSNDSDRVVGASVFFYESDSSNETICRLAIVEAIEEALSGSSRAREYIEQFEELGSSMGWMDETSIANYQLSSGERVSISCDGGITSWTGKYFIVR